MRRAGYRVVLSADVIDTMEVHKTGRAVWNRHRRWGMMRRRLGGALYFGEAFAGALPWALAASSAGAWWPAAFLLAVRYAFEGRVARALGSPLSILDTLLLPARDLGATAVFFASLAGALGPLAGKGARDRPRYSDPPGGLISGNRSARSKGPL